MLSAATHGKTLPYEWAYSKAEATDGFFDRRPERALSRLCQLDDTRSKPGTGVKTHLVARHRGAVEAAIRSKWDDVKEAFGETMLSEVRKHVTNLDDGNIINSVVHTPEDLFRDNRSFVKGSPTGGERTPAQWGAFRLFQGYSQYTPRSAGST